MQQSAALTIVSDKNYQVDSVSTRKALDRTALRTAVEVAEDKAVPPAARIAAARLLLEVTGRIGARQATKAPDSSALSTEQLRAIIDAADREIANRAKPVSVPARGTVEDELFGDKG